MTEEKVSIGKVVTVENNGEKVTKSLQVTIKDRGPFLRDDGGKAIYPLRHDPQIIIDLTPRAFEELTGNLKLGKVPVRVIVS